MSPKIVIYINVASTYFITKSHCAMLIDILDSLISKVVRHVINLLIIIIIVTIIICIVLVLKMALNYFCYYQFFCIGVSELQVLRAIFVTVKALFNECAI